MNNNIKHGLGRLISTCRASVPFGTADAILLILLIMYPPFGCGPGKEAVKEEKKAVPVAPLFSVKILSLDLDGMKQVKSSEDVRKLADIIKKNEIDIVALQDISLPISASRPVYIKELARLTDMELALGTNRLPQMGEHGNAILSRLPVVQSDNIMLPEMKKNNDHGILCTIIDLGTMKVAVLDTHLDEAIGDKDERRIADAFSNLQNRFHEYRSFICATFYDVPKSPLLKSLFESYASAYRVWTYPADEPMYQFSYILYPLQSNFKPDERQTFKTGLSPHRAIVTRLTYFDVPPGHSDN